MCQRTKSRTRHEMIIDQSNPNPLIQPTNDGQGAVYPILVMNLNWFLFRSDPVFHTFEVNTMIEYLTS